MYLDKEKKEAVFEKHSHAGKKEDTGSPEAQIALFTTRIVHLTQHLKLNKQDHSCRRGLMQLVGKRKRLLEYLYRKDIERYRSLLGELNLRK